MKKLKNKLIYTSDIKAAKKDTLFDTLLDARTCLIWLRLIESEKYRNEITKVIKRLDYYIDQEAKDQYN